jgi:hypothetical protein
MSKMTIATDQQGNILGAIQHSEEKSYSDGLKVAVSFAPGTRLQVVDVDPDIDMTKISDVPKFHEALSRRAASAK